MTGMSAVDPLQPHEAAVYQAVAHALQVEEDDRIGYVFPVEGGRIVVDAVFIPTRKTGEARRVSPEQPQGV